MTKLLYLTSPTQSTATAKIIEIVGLENTQFSLVLDQSVFYVQGGGQPSDQGSIFNSKGIFLVSKVILNDQGKVLHIGNFSQGSFEIGEAVSMKIDIDLREKHSKIHSAGHLIDLAIHELELNWQPGKGMHYPESSFVEYQTTNPPQDLQSLQSKIQQEIEKLVEKDITVNITVDETKTFKGQPLRLVDFENQSQTPCGGTHVTSTRLLENTVITKLKVKNSTIKVSYTCLD